MVEPLQRIGNKKAPNVSGPPDGWVSKLVYSYRARIAFSTEQHDGQY